MGLACVLGGIAFTLTFVPSFAYLINYGLCANERKEKLRELSQQNSGLKYHILRDMAFIGISLLLYYLFFGDGALKLWQACTQLGLFVLYVIVFWLHTSADAKAEEEAAEKNEEEEAQRLIA